MLSALMSGKALTATELADFAGITRQTASTHLAQLESGGLLQKRHQGKHRYFCLASEEVAQLIETLMGLSADQMPVPPVTGPRSDALRECRVCYNHLAGLRAVRLYDSLIEAGHLLSNDGELRVSESGAGYLRNFGIELDTLRRTRSPLCRACLDWSERRTHLAGSLGRALFTRFEELGWLKRQEGSREVRFSRVGMKAFDQQFAVSDSRRVQ